MILLIRRIRGRARDHIFNRPPTEGLLVATAHRNFARSDRELRSGGGERSEAIQADAPRVGLLCRVHSWQCRQSVRRRSV